MRVRSALLPAILLLALAAHSTYAAAPRLQTQILGQSSWLSGSRASLRLRALDHSTGQGVANAQIRITLGEAGKAQLLLTSTTDAEGNLTAQFQVPDLPKGSYPMTVEVSALGEKDVVTKSIGVRGETRLLVTTDKPLYQPNQVIHLRALALKEPDLKPLAGAPVTLEVEDSKGNKVFKRSGLTSEFGVAFADFTLADEINLGTYRVRAIADSGTQEQTVTVSKYVLPKFKVSFAADRAFYRPGETMTGQVQADYFFGKPVAGKVSIKLSQFDTGFTDFALVTGTLDAAGHFSFTQNLPDYFAGVPLEQGAAFVKVETTVTDSADQSSTITSTAPVAQDSLRVTAIMEGGQLVSGVDNIVYLVVTTPDGQPTAAELTVRVNGGDASTVSTDASGLAEFHVNGGTGTVNLAVTARDAQGYTGSLKQDLYAGYATTSILARPDKAIYRVGDSLQLDVLTTTKTGTVYVDAIKDGQTMSTAAANIEAGKASLVVNLGPELAGTLELHAYQITKEGQIIRSSRTVVVNPANDLKISVQSDAATYAPGGTANLTLHVTNAANAGVAAALGVNIVDESVFALQDMQPGMEKVYFLLEKQILQPKFEIHAIESDQIVTPYPLPTDPIPDPKAEDVKQRAAAALFAQAEPQGTFTLAVDTFTTKVNSINEGYRQQALSAVAMVRRGVNNFYKKFRRYPPAGSGMILMVRTHLIPWYPIDAFGNRFTVTVNGKDYSTGFALQSRGPDQAANTTDDVYAYYYPGSEPSAWGGEQVPELSFAGSGGNWPPRGGGPGGPWVDGPMPPVAIGAPEDKGTTSAGGNTPSGPTADGVRVRQFFPETLYANPGVITDGSGTATLTVPIADSITTWRLTALGSSADGALGSTTSPLRVFQDFFVDLDFPRTLTQGDEVTVPIAVYNYLSTPQTVNLTVLQEDWFQLLSPAAISVTLQPNEVKGVPVQLVAKGLGYRQLTVQAIGSNLSDAVRREVEVLPAGERIESTINGNLKESITKTINLPAESIEGALNLLVKVYPGIFAQVVEGMDSVLQQPFGCFEQTSSATYPNVLALAYLKATNKAAPEVAMKAEGYINLGYQRLMSFEVTGGGYSWFGEAPANKILTAYGLMELNDMNAVYPIDSALIPKVQAWLLGQQEADGTWTPDKEYLHEESWGRIQHSEILPTAYITWALAETGEKGDKVQKAAAAMANLAPKVEDPYALGLVANAYVSLNRDSQSTTDVLDRLVAMRKTDDEGRVYWGTDLPTATYANHEVGDLEATTIVTYALVRSGKYQDITNKALSYLIAHKDPKGVWASTQATVFALKSLLLSVTGVGDKTDATVRVKVNGEVAAEWKLTPQDSDVMRQVEAKDLVKAGDNEVSLEWDGKGESLYQITGISYVPWVKDTTPPEQQPLTIDVAYDRTELATSDIVTAKAHVAWNASGKAKMVMLDLGLPPGFDVLTEDLTAMVDRKQIQKYSVTGRQIIIYLEELANGAPLDLVYRLKAKYPIKAQTPASQAYLYYNPEVKATWQPQKLVVN